MASRSGTITRVTISDPNVDNTTTPTKSSPLPDITAPYGRAATATLAEGVTKDVDLVVVVAKIDDVIILLFLEDPLVTVVPFANLTIII